MSMIMFRKMVMKRGYWLFLKNDEGSCWFLGDEGLCWLLGDEGLCWLLGVGVFDGGLEGLEVIEVFLVEYVFYFEYFNLCDWNR